VLADADGIVSCDASPLFNGYPCVGDAGGTPHPNPDFCTGCGNGLPGFAFRDVGIVDLDDDPVPTIVVSTYAALPTAGQVDTLPNKTPIDFVGYGVQVQFQIPGTLFRRFGRPGPARRLEHGPRRELLRHERQLQWSRLRVEGRHPRGVDLDQIVRSLRLDAGGGLAAPS
jgi:hypothetical protein